ncbi:hypothetical protein HY546_02455 [archaeon]|nr:hypothetical protein [archaeon]
MDSKFCPRCGREGDLYKGFCFKCSGELARLVDFPASIELRKCRKCSRMLLNGEWVEETPENFRALVLTGVNAKLHDYRASVERGRDYVFVSVSGHADPAALVSIKDEARLHLRTDESLCGSCFRTSAQKYEVKIQLRKKEEHDENRLKKVESFIQDSIFELSKTDHKASSFWREETREGSDFLIGYREIGEKIAKALSSKFRLRLEKSMQQRGVEKSGKRRIKITFCVRV